MGIMKAKGYILLICSVMVFNEGCKKNTLAPASSTSINSQNVFTDDATTANVLSGIYISLMNNNNITNEPLLDIGFYTALSSDELAVWSGATNTVFTSFYTNQLTNIAIQGL